MVLPIFLRSDLRIAQIQPFCRKQMVLSMGWSLFVQEYDRWKTGSNGQLIWQMLNIVRDALYTKR